MRRRTEDRLALALAVLVLLAFLSPLAWLLLVSLRTRAQIFAWPPPLLPPPTLANYRALFAGGSHVGQALGNSLLAAGAAAALSLAVGLPAAHALAGARFRLGRGVGAAVLLLRLLPPVTLLLPYYLMARAAGLLGRLPAIAIAHLAFCLPVVVWMMRASFAALPHEVEEAARLDGASRWQALRLVAVPMARAGVAASAIFAVLTSWNEFLFATVLSRPETQTLPVAVAAFVGDVYVSWGELAAATVIGMVPALLLAFLGQRWLLAGMASGTVR